ncbi:hypothetical protein N665_0244s0029 [Sinapis alba]|nr:hypothetical protein N665_0244s0029 [Sinapis alba]
MDIFQLHKFSCFLETRAAVVSFFFVSGCQNRAGSVLDREHPIEQFSSSQALDSCWSGGGLKSETESADPSSLVRVQRSI